MPRILRAAAAPQHGFTLVETLVALAVVAIALSAGVQAMSALTRLSERQGDQLLAQICAENEMAKVRLSRQMPGVGASSSTCTQAGRDLPVATGVWPTPNPNFRRVEVGVLSDDSSTPHTLLKLSTVVGRY
jgi:general secretion pathway protein I